MIDKVRCFDPLKNPNRKYDLVFHLPVCFDNIDRRQGVDRDFRCLKFQIENFKQVNPSNNPNFKMLLCISVNGGISSYSYVEYLNSIGNRLTNNIDIIVFQRPNVGWQWGGLHDVYMRYKNHCDFFCTCECDVWFFQNGWFDICLSRIKKDVGFIGMPPGDHTLPNIHAYADFNIPVRVWRDGNNNIINRPNVRISKHSRGGWYLCTKKLLDRMDDVYGCFTFALGHSNALDGIVLGEVGFSHKTEQLGFTWLCSVLANVFEKDDI